MNKLLKQAFTLIELLVVIAIIGILSGLIIVGMNGMTQKATIAKAQVFSNSLRNSLMMNIVGEWKFDEGTGQSAADSWSKVNNGTLGSAAGVDANDPTWTTSGCVFGNCLSFDGNDYVDCGSGVSLNVNTTMTISLWVYPTNLTTNNSRLIHKYDDVNNYYEVLLYGSGGYDGKVDVVFGIGGTKYETGLLYAPTLNAWNHIAVIFSSGTIKTYINGIDRSGGGGGAASINNLSINLFIGNWPRLDAGYFGLIDDVRIYNAAIPTSQIKEQYYAGLNKLLANGVITKEEYQNRIGELAIEL